VYTVRWKTLKERDHLLEPGVNGRIILRWILGSGMWCMDWVELAQERQVAGTCECGNKPSGSIKCGEFLDWLKTG
jgi:hypothetical protein